MLKKCITRTVKKKKRIEPRDIKRSRKTEERGFQCFLLACGDIVGIGVSSTKSAGSGEWIVLGGLENGVVDRNVYFGQP